MYIYVTIMPRYRTMHSFYLDPELAAGLKEIKQQRGVPESEQVRRAIRAWLEAEGITLKPAPRARQKRGTRKK